MTVVRSGATRPAQIILRCYAKNGSWLAALECSLSARTRREPNPRSGSHLWHHRHTPIARHGHTGQTHRTSVALAELFCRTTDRIDPARVHRPCRRLGRGASCAGSCKLTPAITTRSGRTGHWIKMRRPPVRFSRPEALNRTLSLVDFITITFESRFSVHTADCQPATSSVRLRRRRASRPTDG
jgi:hypothetical protein